MTAPTSLAETAIRPAPDFRRLEFALKRGGKPDRTPFYELFVNTEIMEAVLGKAVPDRAATAEFYYRAGYDYVPVWPRLELKTGSLTDTSLSYPIQDRRTFDAYRWPGTGEIGFGEFDKVLRVLPDGMMMIGQTGGIFERVQSLCGYTGLCMLLADDRELVRALFDRVGALWEAMYRGMARQEKVGALVISDDLGFKTQTLLAPDDIREFIVPWYRKLAAAAHDAGLPCIMHSCGQLSEVMDDLIGDVGIDAKHSYEDSILPVTEAKRLYGGRIAILGGFDVDRLCRSDEAEIRAHTRLLLDTCGRDGGYALGSGNSIAKYVPVPSYLTMLDEGWKRSISDRGH